MPHTEPLPLPPRATDVQDPPPPLSIFLPANVMQALGLRAERAEMSPSAVVCDALVRLGASKLVELVNEAPVPSVAQKLRFTLFCTPPAHVVLHAAAAQCDASLSRLVQLALVATAR